MNKIDVDVDRVIFLTRNPKELLIRYYGKEIKSIEGIYKKFLDSYLDKFYCFELLASKNRMLLFYEDIICNIDDHLLDILDFTQEKPVYYINYLRRV